MNDDLEQMITDIQYELTEYLQDAPVNIFDRLDSMDIYELCAQKVYDEEVAVAEIRAEEAKYEELLNEQD